ncbi:Hint domain-containing protein [Paracoccus aestuariivivens]|uniref:Hemolysin-type calcium-binding region n=1 Tax=Paracoccus aestuariivivens TaxID=1820333 RepID=A0A6L6J8R4_9RHOB|nr:Hint domain-containing protein [Paracoccus aestuariivivens]MTH77037.1 hemolysin-type calcium-binding region [Paracoccus aestuariivivens]
MTYVTEIPATSVSIGTDGTASFTGSFELSDVLNNSTEWTQYKIDAQGATSLSSGDNFTLISSNDEDFGCTYLGGGTLNFEPVNGVFANTNYQIQLAPVSGSLVEAYGHYYFVTDAPLNDDNIVGSLSVTLNQPDGQAADLSVTAPLSELADALATEVDEIPGSWADQVAADLRGLDDQIASLGYGATATISHDPSVERPLTEAEILCFVSGTLISTDRGLVAVQDLMLGDMVWTKDDGFQPIRWIGSSKLSPTVLAQKPNLRPIRIRAGALGADRPSQDLLVSPQHRILVRSKIAVRMFGAMEVLIPAKQLLQVDGIDYADDIEAVEYYHFLFDRHQIVISNGAETESLYTGPQAMRTLPSAARAEVIALFPELEQADHQPESIRLLPSGRQSRKFAQRHASKQRALVC